MLDLSEEDDDDEYEDDVDDDEEYEGDDEPSEAELLIQEGMKEVFAEETEVDDETEDIDFGDTLAVAETDEEPEDADYYDEEDGQEETFGEFTLDFIDLDD